MSNNGIRVEVGKRENIEQLLRRFKKVCQDASIQSEIKRRTFYVKPSELKRERRKARMITIKKAEEERKKQEPQH